MAKAQKIAGMDFLRTRLRLFVPLITAMLLVARWMYSCQDFLNMERTHLDFYTYHEFAAFIDDEVLPKRLNFPKRRPVSSEMTLEYNKKYSSGDRSTWVRADMQMLFANGLLSRERVGQQLTLAVYFGAEPAKDITSHKPDIDFESYPWTKAVPISSGGYDAEYIHLDQDPDCPFSFVGRFEHGGLVYYLLCRSNDTPHFFFEALSWLTGG